MDNLDSYEKFFQDALLKKTVKSLEEMIKQNKLNDKGKAEAARKEAAESENLANKIAHSDYNKTE
jgi:hypothetical protein